MTEVAPAPTQQPSGDSEPRRPGRSQRGVTAATSDVALFAVLIAASIAFALSLAALLLQVTGSPPGAAFSAMLRGSVGSTSSIVTTLNHTAPILVIAIGAAIAGRAALVNIGQEGQVVIGATLGVVVGLSLSGPRPLVLVAVLLASAIGGGLWAGIAALLRYASKVNEVITTLLLNFIAFSLVSYLVNRPSLLQESLPEGTVQAASPQSDALPPEARLPLVVSGSGFRLHLGIVIAVLLAVLVAFVISRTTWGFRLRMFGLNSRAARRAGVNGIIFGSGALILSGAFAGLGGGVLLSGVAFRVNPGLSNHYGWEGLLVALVAGFRPLVAAGVAVLFGALRAGGGALTATGVHSSIVGVVQALIVLAVMLPALYMRRRRRNRQAVLLAAQESA